MPHRFFEVSNGMYATIAGGSGFLASVIPTLPDSTTLEVLGRWPLTVILGAVCVIVVYFMYRQSRDNADKTAISNQAHCDALIKMAEGERIAAEKRTIVHASATKELAENNAKLLRELTETHSREVRQLLDEIIGVGHRKVI
jgi:hypothetical protein